MIINKRSKSLTETMLLLYAIKFRQFMLINKKHSFSSDEILAVSKQITHILAIKNKSLNNNINIIINVLSQYGINNIRNKHSHSMRHRYWFVKPLCPNTLKVSANV